MNFGRRVLPLWPLDSDAIYLNHGTVGVVPVQVAEAQQVIRDEIERHPSKFMLRDVFRFSGTGAAGPTLMRKAAADVASFVGARTDDLVFVDNTTAGVNAVIRSMAFRPGDEILITDHIYGGLLPAATYVARTTGAVVRSVELPFPAFDPVVCVERLQAALTERTRLVVVDHIASESGLIFPIAEIVKVCHARGVQVLVDGAHVPGQLALDVSAIGADYYVANLHKWAMAPRSSAFLVVAPEHQGAVHPAVISWGFETGFTQEFDWVGTRDPSPWLCAPDGIRFLESLDYDALRQYNHNLAWHAARHLSNAWGTSLEIDESAVGCMVSVMAPERVGVDKADADRLRDRLLHDHNIEVHTYARAGRAWVRVSIQAYNDENDIDTLARAV